MKLTYEEQASIESLHKIKDKMINFDHKIHELFKNKPELFKKPEFRYYTKNKTNNKTKNQFENVENIYLTTVFISEVYIPGALVLAHSCKKVKSKYPIVCMVQDVPYEENGKVIFSGVSNKTIMDLLTVFDMVIGVDLLKVKNYDKSSKMKHFTNTSSTYRNILYYITKAQILALTQFKKVLYIDATYYFLKNIDYLFIENDVSTFLEEPEVYKFTKIGLRGGTTLFCPNMIYYYKLLSFVNNYDLFFGDLHFRRGVDEIITFFAVFPHWNDKLLPGEIMCIPKFERPWSINKEPIEKLVVRKQDYCLGKCFMIHKPFRAKPDEYTDEYFEKISLLFYEWDRFAHEVIQKYDHLKIYFEHIPKIRKEHIFTKNDLSHISNKTESIKNRSTLKRKEGSKLKKTKILFPKKEKSYSKSSTKLYVKTNQ